MIYPTDYLNTKVTDVEEANNVMTNVQKATQKTCCPLIKNHKEKVSRSP